jgi:hypothetical protein
MFPQGLPLSHYVVVFVVLLLPTRVATIPHEFQHPLDFSAADGWHKYVRSPSTQVIYPAGIVANYTQGNVSNPGGFPTTLTRLAPSSHSSTAAPTESIPTIVVDFGQNIAGYLSIKFRGAYSATTGLPGLRIAFSESLQHLAGDVSDFSRSNNVIPRTGPFKRLANTLIRETQSLQEATR